MWWCCGTVKNVELVSAPISTKPTYAKPLNENTSESLHLSGTDPLEAVVEVVAEKAPLVQAEPVAEPQAEAVAEPVAEPVAELEAEPQVEAEVQEAGEVQEEEEAQEAGEEAEEAQEAGEEAEEAQEAEEEAAQEAGEEAAQEADDEVSETSYNSDESDTSQLLQVEVKIIRVKRYVCSKNLKTSVSIFLFGTAAYFLANLNEFRRFFTQM